MDLTVNTKQYTFSASSGFDYIFIYLMNNMKKSANSNGINNLWYLTKKEVKTLIKYLEENTPDNYKDRQNWIVDRLINLEMLMEGKEKAEFHFW